MQRQPRFIPVNGPLVSCICLAVLLLCATNGSCETQAGIERVVVGPLKTNCYLLYDKRSLDAIIIDPGDEPDRIIRAIEMRRLKVRRIVLTHGHFDHIGAVARLKEKTGAPVWLHRSDRALYRKAGVQAAKWGFAVDDQPSPDRFLGNAEDISIGELRFRAIAAPGHSPGSICLYGEGAVFTGDTVFAGSVGRTDLPGGDMGELKRSFEKIMALPPGTRIFPGHGSDSTVGKEREQILR